MPQFACSNNKTMSKTRSVLNVYSWTANRDMLSSISSRPIHAATHVLSSLSFVAIKSSVDDDSLSDFDPIHVLLFGINKLIEECLDAMLENVKRTTRVLKTRSGFCRTIK